MKEYKKLDKLQNYDKEAVTELAEALNEVRALEARIQYLSRIIRDNDNYRDLLWRTKNGEFIATHDITNEHLENIIRFLEEKGEFIPQAIANEAKKRGITVNSTNIRPPVFIEPSASILLTEGESVPGEDDIFVHNEPDYEY